MTDREVIDQVVAQQRERFHGAQDLQQFQVEVVGVGEGYVDVERTTSKSRYRFTPDDGVDTLAVGNSLSLVSNEEPVAAPKISGGALDVRWHVHAPYGMGWGGFLDRYVHK